MKLALFENVSICLSDSRWLFAMVMIVWYLQQRRRTLCFTLGRHLHLRFTENSDVNVMTEVHILFTTRFAALQLKLAFPSFHEVKSWGRSTMIMLNNKVGLRDLVAYFCSYIHVFVLFSGSIRHSLKWKLENITDIQAEVEEISWLKGQICFRRQLEENWLWDVRLGVLFPPDSQAVQLRGLVACESLKLSVIHCRQ